MTIKIGINGFGRMGRLSMRAAFDWDDVEIVHINDPAGDAATLAHLMTFDSVHGRWHHEATHQGDAIVINGKAIPCTQNKATQGACTQAHIDDAVTLLNVFHHGVISIRQVLMKFQAGLA